MKKGIIAAISGWIFYLVTIFNILQLPIPEEFIILNQIIPASPLVLGHSYLIHRYHVS